MCGTINATFQRCLTNVEFLFGESGRSITGAVLTVDAGNTA
jgi:hypothetical protein